jgi:hypothetical protein
MWFLFLVPKSVTENPMKKFHNPLEIVLESQYDFKRIREESGKIVNFLRLLTWE